ncbi:phage tail protein [Pseudomonas putida]|uniref:Tail fiber protein n=1 Tax=Pseudomonas putida TaxID=303 RepID=A0A1B2FE35_PSEPU|nr:phage tail protein [Pseudomonas putida]ANY90432.1 Tail fiber protein [Pseudomonas putida]
MGAAITLAGESLIAQKQVNREALDVQRFIFANVPGLDSSGPVDRAAGKPAPDRIVYTADIPDSNAGFVNPNQVVYSLQVGSDVGDWDFNWIGLETAEGVLFAVAYVPLQQKRRNIPPLQLGNNITRNFLVAYDGAQALTGITIDASTWQHDFTVRLAGIDERERLSNRDVYGRACFFGSALQVEKVGSQYQIKPGTAYVEGIRVQRDAPLPIAPPALPTTAWLDVALQRELSDVVASWSVVFGAGLADHTDSAGVRHYLVPIADLVSSVSLVDRRPVESIGGPLVQHFAARVGDYPDLRARATTKDDVDLGNLPNAKSDDPVTDYSSEILATTKAVGQAAKSHQVLFAAPGVSVWQVPDILKKGVKYAKVTIIGGGGGGGRHEKCGGGGGGGGVAEKIIDLTGISEVTITVGAGGLGRTGSTGEGNNGVTTSFGAIFSATGGIGASKWWGGPGGTGIGGDLNTSLGPGAHGTRHDNATSPGSAYGGGHGGGPGGSGSGSGVIANAGSNALLPGGGGGGGNENGNGANGAPGMVRIEY